ncbi:mitochondrial carrier 2-like protein [Dinothrombium tinctorium]|uniref:Mitochondrial carrier 2-like protein n=1 Tax=Dinothrombium tinctorium TaxID=1965070 RepID=A0A3S3NUL4_9ACAR|nr:mitochondrial carrier 2-like protein [Dinothrombium tinctorium]RWS08726.1 mitochondrial carrier 2-like protein [Dinothrombium tinctorium]
MSLSRIEFHNNFGFEEAVGRIVVAAIAHPFDYVKVLIQLGYEPFQPYPTTTIFMRRRMALPGVFSFLRLIRERDGFWGMFRGVSYKICFTLTNGFVHANISDFLMQIENRNKAKPEKRKNSSGFEAENIQKFVDTLVRETTCKFISISISYPFQVLAIRCCAQFVGRETVYNSLHSAVYDIYSNEGVLGFYSGFVPRFLGECLVLWTTHSFVFLIEGFVKSDSSLSTYIATTTNFIVQSIMYPFHVVATVMSVNNASSLAASRLEPQFLSWVDCWNHLSKMGQLKRGSSIFWRYPNEATLQPFYSKTEVPNIYNKKSI